MSMCLVREWWTGFFEMHIALLLSHIWGFYGSSNRSLREFGSTTVVEHSSFRLQHIRLRQLRGLRSVVFDLTTIQVILLGIGMYHSCFFDQLGIRQNPHQCILPGLDFHYARTRSQVQLYLLSNEICVLRPYNAISW